MAGTVTPVYLGERSAPVWTVGFTCRSRPGRANWGKSNRSVTRDTKHFFREFTGIGTFSLESNWTVRPRAKDLWSSCRSSLPGKYS